MCLVPNLVAHPRDDGPPPFDEFVPRTQHSTRQLAARPWLRRPSPIPPLISRGAEQALASRTNAFRLNPSSWTDRPSIGLGPPWPVKAEKAIKPANAIADAFVALRWQEDEEDQRWGGGDDKGEVPDPPHGAREDDNLPFDDRASWTTARTTPFRTITGVVPRNLRADRVID